MERSFNKFIEKPAIVVVAYKRWEALTRLLNSIQKGLFEYEDINLIISIDGGGSIDVIDVANNFHWAYGQKEVITYSQNLGLRNHVLKCGDLTEKYGSVIMLEEDCFVAPNFYIFSQQALNFYSDDKNIAGIGLYSYALNEHNWLLFNPLKDGYDNYFMQVPCSWGQAWNEVQWSLFKDFYNETLNYNANTDIPKNVRSWPETSWKKHFYNYLINENKYFVYPQISQTTNFGEKGEHTSAAHSFLQVVLDVQNKGLYKFSLFNNSSNKFDPFFEILPGSFGMPEDICIDLYGLKDIKRLKNTIVYSIKECVNPIRQYGYNMRPNFMNVINEVQGDEINVGKSEDFISLNENKIKRLFQMENFHSFNKGVQSMKDQIEKKSDGLNLNILKRLFQRIKATCRNAINSL